MSWRREWPYALGAMLVALGVAVLTYRLWNADLSVPLHYPYGDEPKFRFTDTLFVQMVVQAVHDHGWYLSNGDLGAPFGQQLYDFPVLSGDTLQIVQMQVLSLFTGESGVVMNLIHLASFPLVALTAYAALRLLDISPPVAMTCAALYALLPYHFVEARSSITVASYYAVPLGCWLVLATLRGDNLRARLPAVVIALVLLVGAGGIYFAAFTLMLLAVAAVLTYAVTRSRTILVQSLVVAAIVGGGLALANLPTFVHEAEHGHNGAAAVRTAQDSDYFSLNAFKLLAPMDGHRLSPLSRLSTARQGAGDAQWLTLGLFASIGVLYLLGVAAMTLVTARRDPDDRPRHTAVIALATFLIGTTGGVAAIFAYEVDPQLRAWYRLAVVLGFLGLFAFALLLDRLRGRVSLPLVLGIVLVVGALDQTSNRFVPDYEPAKAEFESDAAFAAAVEDLLPAKAMVFQLPYVPFPEGPGGPANVYNHLKGYVHSRDLRWSFGAMKGRPENWAAELPYERLDQVLPGVTAAGFQAVWVDRPAYGDELDAAEDQLRAELGPPALTSPNGARELYDLRPYASRLQAERSPESLARLRDQTLHPPEHVEERR